MTEIKEVNDKITERTTAIERRFDDVCRSYHYTRYETELVRNNKLVLDFIKSYNGEVLYNPDVPGDFCGGKFFLSDDKYAKEVHVNMNSTNWVGVIVYNAISYVECDIIMKQLEDFILERIQS